MLKVKSLLFRSFKEKKQKKTESFIAVKETDLMLLLMFCFFSFRRKPDQRSAESSSCLEERSMASSSTASDGTKLGVEGSAGSTVYLELF